MKEVWKDIPGYEGLYQASTSGEVKSLPHYTVSSSGKKRFFGGGLVAPQKGTGGYYHVVLHKNGKKTTRLLNRIILITFMGYKAGCDANHRGLRRLPPSAIDNPRRGTATLINFT